MDELQKAIKTARDVYDRPEELTRTSVALGALIRAVELLAEQQRETADEPTRMFPSDLVERLARVAYLSRESRMWETWEALPTELKPETRGQARAILTELAKAPVELPTDEEISNALHVEPGHSATIVANLFRDRVVPIVAAKDALILSQKREALHLESKLASAERSIEWHRQEATAASIELGFSGSTIEEAVRKKNKAHDADKLRIVELEAFRSTVAAVTPFTEDDGIVQHAADIVSNIEGRTYRKAFYEKTVPELRARIVDLEAANKELYKDRRESIEAHRRLDARNAPTQSETTQWLTLGERIDALKSRLPANECSNAERTQYEVTIEQQKARIAELERDGAQRDHQHRTSTALHTAFCLGLRDALKIKPDTAPDIVGMVRGIVKERDNLKTRLDSNAATLADQIKYAESLLADRARQNDEVESLKAGLADARTHRDILGHQCSAIQTILGATISESATDVAARVANEQAKLKDRCSKYEESEGAWHEGTGCHDGVDALKLINGFRERSTELETANAELRIAFDGAHGRAKEAWAKVVELEKLVNASGIGDGSGARNIWFAHF